MVKTDLQANLSELKKKENVFDINTTNALLGVFGYFWEWGGGAWLYLWVCLYILY